MSSNHPIHKRYEVGVGHTPSYQASARPFIQSNITAPASGSSTATPIEIAFPNVSKFVTVRNDGDDDVEENGMNAAAIRVGFSAQGMHDEGYSYYNHVKLAPSASFSADYRITRLYLMSDDANTPEVTVMAGLTGIVASHLTASWQGLLGVGGSGTMANI